VGSQDNQTCRRKGCVDPCHTACRWYRLHWYAHASRVFLLRQNGMYETGIIMQDTKKRASRHWTGYRGRCPTPPWHCLICLIPAPQSTFLHVHRQAQDHCDNVIFRANLCADREMVLSTCLDQTVQKCKAHVHVVPPPTMRYPSKKISQRILPQTYCHLGNGVQTSERDERSLFARTGRGIIQRVYTARRLTSYRVGCRLACLARISA
jgi:hypothetical protein